MNYSEDNYIMISALQHFAFCPRQCAFIHIEQVWKENYLTAEGRIVHEKAHSGGTEKRSNIRIARALPINSPVLGITGVTDVVEFHKQDDGTEIVFPVEYKRGQPKEGNCDRIQLCAQAMCIEYMLKIQVLNGALFYGKNQHRENVEFTHELREMTKNMCRDVHALIDSGVTPAPIYSKKCKSCSLSEICMPNVVNKKSRRYINNVIKEIIK